MQLYRGPYLLALVLKRGSLINWSSTAVIPKCIGISASASLPYPVALKQDVASQQMGFTHQSRWTMDSMLARVSGPARCTSLGETTWMHTMAVQRYVTGRAASGYKAGEVRASTGKHSSPASRQKGKQRMGKTIQELAGDGNMSTVSTRSAAALRTGSSSKEPCSAADRRMQQKTNPLHAAPSPLFIPPKYPEEPSNGCNTSISHRAVGQQQEPTYTNRLKKCSSLNTLQQLLELKLSTSNSFTAAELAVALSKLAGLSRANAAAADPELVKTITSAWLSVLPTAEGVHIAAVADAWVQLKYFDPKLWQHSLQAFLQPGCLQSCIPYGLHLMLRSLLKAGHCLEMNAQDMQDALLSIVSQVQDLVVLDRTNDHWYQKALRELTAMQTNQQQDDVNQTQASSLDMCRVAKKVQQIISRKVSRKVQEADLQAIQRLLQRSHSQLTSVDVAQIYKRLYELRTQQEAVALVPDLLQQLTPLWLSKLPEARPHEIAAALVTCQHYGYANENLWYNSMTAVTKESCLLHARVQDIINIICAAASSNGSWSIPGMTTETAAAIFKVLAAQLPAPEQSKASMQIIIRLLDKFRRWGGSLHELLRDINHAQDMSRSRMGERAQSEISRAIKATNSLSELQQVLAKHMEDVHCGSTPIATAYMQIANMTAQAGSSGLARHSTGPILHQLDKKWDWVMPAAKPDDIANLLFSWWRMEHVPEFELWHDTLNCFLRWTAHNPPDGCITPADVAKVMRSLETSRSYGQSTGSLNGNISPMAVSEAAVQLVRHMYTILQLEKYSGPNKQPAPYPGRLSLLQAVWVVSGYCNVGILRAAVHGCLGAEASETAAMAGPGAATEQKQSPKAWTSLNCVRIWCSRIERWRLLCILRL